MIFIQSINQTSLILHAGRVFGLTGKKVLPQIVPPNLQNSVKAPVSILQRVELMRMKGDEKKTKENTSSPIFVRSSAATKFIPWQYPTYYFDHTRWRDSKTWWKQFLWAKTRDAQTPNTHTHTQQGSSPSTHSSLTSGSAMEYAFRTLLRASSLQTFAEMLRPFTQHK